MREHLEIAPEIRGLLEELVADPRSSIRLVPRRPLRSWFESDETIRPREISGTKLERHLIAAHREELAQLLFEASRIAYWKAPVLTVHPVGSDGGPFDSIKAEEAWRPRARNAASAGDPSGRLLGDCLGNISPEKGSSLSLASLALVPSDKTRFAFSQCIQWNRPRTAISVLRGLSARARSASFYPDVLRVLASRLCAVDRLFEARAFYRESLKQEPTSQVSWMDSLNLSCFLDDERSAVEDAAGFDKHLRRTAPDLGENKDLLRNWIKCRARDQARSRDVARRVASKGYESASVLLEVFEP